MNWLETSHEAVEEFHSLLDCVFYEGYAARLAADYPEHYELELTQFLNNYSR